MTLAHAEAVKNIKIVMGNWIKQTINGLFNCHVNKKYHIGKNTICKMSRVLSKLE
ncbi:hypothetical protein SAMN04487752_2163 [Carnobacterium viridans]|uniref:Uncharacterized protein n=1 Tax=Carnobacterium viridans TaxID=174587 RepID=A0A1H1ANI2_9LACT|nr:hypothetical protein SAMN04487752_2163 [Carnobacterium viridans]